MLICIMQIVMYRGLVSTELPKGTLPSYSDDILVDFSSQVLIIGKDEGNCWGQSPR